MARGEIMKTVAVSDDVYKILIRIKYEKNFKNVSEVIDYLIKRNNAGRWRNENTDTHEIYECINF